MMYRHSIFCTKSSLNQCLMDFQIQVLKTPMQIFPSQPAQKRVCIEIGKHACVKHVKFAQCNTQP